jgi:hypothetical protein
MEADSRVSSVSQINQKCCRPLNGHSQGDFWFPMAPMKLAGLHVNTKDGD